MIIPDSMTFGQMREIERHNPQMPQYAHRLTARTYQAFLDTLYCEIDTIIAALVKDANTLQGDGHTENSINADIVRQLNRAGYTAHFDKNKRGHADVTVEYGRYEWIGEGKKVKSVDNTHLRGGYDQLRHRYVSGTTNADQAALLIYCYAPSSKHVLGQWSQHLETHNKTNPGYSDGITPCKGNEDFAFWSTSTHPSSGAQLTVKHIIASLHWAPPP
ncbi:hypothetical protein [Massilia varians]|uniref:hypothetical protein n=1 Tax=Massilia varians TaxID=457921 RepID=UPI002556CA69|nr:hypothetical protein [Massilia varians]MDK6078659.1 hypothetical protein [Massilia varians]